MTDRYDDEKRKAYNKLYYEKNKEKICKYMTDKTDCPKCDKKIQKSALDRHMARQICGKAIVRLKKGVESNKEYKKVLQEKVALDKQINQLRELLNSGGGLPSGKKPSREITVSIKSSAQTKLASPLENASCEVESELDTK